MTNARCGHLEIEAHCTFVNLSLMNQEDNHFEPQLCFRSMRWGLVPSTHNKPLKEFNLPTHNCRSETILERPIFSRAFKRGQRCVIPIDGFYEWNSTKGAEKIPHFVYCKREEAEASAGINKVGSIFVSVYLYSFKCSKDQ